MKVGDWSWKPHPAWEPPARRTQQNGDDGPEGDEDAKRVDETVAAKLLALFAGGLDEGEALEEEHGEDAGHQVEDDAAEEGEADGGGGGDSGGCGLRGRWGRRSDLAGDNGGGELIGFGVRELEQAVKLGAEGVLRSSERGECGCGGRRGAARWPARRRWR